MLLHSKLQAIIGIVLVCWPIAACKVLSQYASSFVCRYDAGDSHSHEGCRNFRIWRGMLPMLPQMLLLVRA